MQECWLYRINSDKLIVFYNGWGMDENPFLHLKSDEYDVVMFYDYSSLPEKKIIFQEYKNIFHIGFSFGVFIMGLLFQNEIININNSNFFLINGSFKMISKDYGIHPKIFESTLENLSETGVIPFYKNMFFDKKDFQIFMNNKPGRDFNDQLRELLRLKELCESDIFSQSFVKSALICRWDKIIFPIAQKKFCNEKSISYKEIDSGHFPFFMWKSWDEVLKEFIA